MSKINGPKQKIKQFLCRVIYPHIVYATSVWETALRAKSHAKILRNNKIDWRLWQQQFTKAAQVISGMMTIELMIKERALTYKNVEWKRYILVTK